MTRLGVLGTSIVCAVLTGCDRGPADGPPAVRLGDSVCAQCNMIISDARWATATMVEGPRGAEPRLFDDFNCQVNYEMEHGAVTARWSHCHATGEWVPTAQAWFVMSPELRTPMGSKTAAFADASEAEAARERLTGDVMSFEIAWKRLGFAGACAHDGDAPDTDAEQEAHDGP